MSSAALKVPLYGFGVFKSSVAYIAMEIAAFVHWAGIDMLLQSLCVNELPVALETEAIPS
jgi:hypothetical protein